MAVSFTTLAVIAVIVGPRSVAHALVRLRPEWVVAAVAVSVLQVLASAWRWRFTAARLGVHLPYRRAITEYYLATFLNQVLPGGVLGDVSRAWRHARGQHASDFPRSESSSPSLRSVHAVVLERFSGQVVMMFVAAISAASLGGVHTLVVGAAMLPIVGFALHRVRFHLRLPTEEGFGGNARRALGGSALPVQLASSVLIVASYLAVYLLAARAVGVTTPTLVLLPLLAPVLVTMLLPVTVAGWGVREGAAAALWGAVGLTAADGVTVSVAYGLLVLVSSLPGAAVVVLTLRGEGPDRTARRRREGSSGPAVAAHRRASRSEGA